MVNAVEDAQRSHMFTQHQSQAEMKILGNRRFESLFVEGGPKEGAGIGVPYPKNVLIFVFHVRPNQRLLNQRHWAEVKYCVDLLSTPMI